jgi:hypothetical protein
MSLTMKNSINSRLLMIFCFLILLTFQGCKQKPIVFYGYTFNDKYNLEIPDYFSKESEGKWLTTKDNGVQWIKMFELKKEIGDLEQQMTEFVSLSTGNLYDGMVLREKDTLNFNGYKCLFCYYNKNNNSNKTGYPVMTYIIFAIIQDNQNFMVFHSFALGQNNYEEMKKTIMSIKPKN